MIGYLLVFLCEQLRLGVVCVLVQYGGVGQGVQCFGVFWGVMVLQEVWCGYYIKVYFGQLLYYELVVWYGVDVDVDIDFFFYYVGVLIGQVQVEV